MRYATEEFPAAIPVHFYDERFRLLPDSLLWQGAHELPVLHDLARYRDQYTMQYHNVKNG